jgi:Zn-dependent protease with chaperone function
VLNLITRHTLSLLDRSLFSPTSLTEARQRQISSRFLALTHPASPIPLQVTFRSSHLLGANAMALPNGTIVVTDDLVTLAAKDEEILAVLAHEAGHVEERHGLRNVIQSSVVSVLISWYLGDVNAIVAAAPAVLMEAKYSRDLEREADDYAARFLAANGLPVSLLGDMLEKLETDRSGGSADAGSAAYLSSHPTTKERIERLRGD